MFSYLPSFFQKTRERYTASLEFGAHPDPDKNNDWVLVKTQIERDEDWVKVESDQEESSPSISTSVILKSIKPAKIQTRKDRQKKYKPNDMILVLGIRAKEVQSFCNESPSSFSPQIIIHMKLILGNGYSEYVETREQPWIGIYEFPVSDLLKSSKYLKNQFTYALEYIINGTPVRIKGCTSFPKVNVQMVDEFFLFQMHAIFQNSLLDKHTKIIQLQKMLERCQASSGHAAIVIQRGLQALQPMTINHELSSEMIEHKPSLLLDNTDYRLVDYKVNLAEEKRSPFLILVNNDVKTCEAVTVTADFFSSLKKTYPALFAKKENDPKKILIKVAHKVREIFSKKDISGMVKLIPGKLVKYPLEMFIKAGTGLSRHEGLFTACLLSELIKNEICPLGKVYLYRGIAYNLTVHTWVIYESENALFLIDPSMPEKIYNLKDIVTLTSLINKYEMADLPGILDILLQHYPLKVKSDMTEIDKRAIAIIGESKLTEEGAKASLVCHLTHKIMKKPMILKTEDGRHHCFEEANLLQHLQNKGTHPVTQEKLKLDKIQLMPAPAKLKQIWNLILKLAESLPEKTMENKPTKRLLSWLTSDSEHQVEQTIISKPFIPTSSL